MFVSALISTDRFFPVLFYFPAMHTIDGALPSCLLHWDTHSFVDFAVDVIWEECGLTALFFGTVESYRAYIWIFVYRLTW